VRFDEELHQLLDDMRETMYHSQGIGLAGNQVNVTLRVAVLDVSEDKSGPLDVVNPEIIGTTGNVASSEGCLSIPEYRDTIARHKGVTVRAFNRLGEEYTIEANGILAICLQHEIDHLNGVLFTDHLSFLKRQFFQKWCKKHLSVATT
jgi:peptide deformylase